MLRAETRLSRGEMELEMESIVTTFGNALDGSRKEKNLSISRTLIWILLLHNLARERKKRTCSIIHET